MPVVRFRLHFEEYAFDMTPGVYLIGRGENCEIVVQDTKVSRTHARLRITEGGAYLQDLQSSNGTFVNGESVCEETHLRNKDRVCVGRQDILCSVLSQQPRKQSQTISKVTKANGSGDDNDWYRFFFDELIAPALEANKSKEAVRLFEKFSIEIERRLGSGWSMTKDFVTFVSVYALRIAECAEDARWVSWVISLHRRVNAVPDEVTITHLMGLEPLITPAIREELRQFVYWKRAVMRSMSTENREGLSLIEKLALSSSE